MKALLPYLLLTVLAVSLLSTTTEAAVSGYWRFEEGVAGNTASGADSILDSSGNGNHGTPAGGPTYSSTIPGSFPASNTLSLNFDGANDTVSVANSASLNNTSAFTVEFWMRSPGTGSGQDLLVDKSHGFTDSSGWLFQSQPGTGIIFFAVGLGGGSSTNFQGVLSNDDLFDNEWHHLAGTYDGNTTEFFVDGISQGTNAVGTYVGNTRSVRVGNTQSSSRFFQGQFDELRISDTVLTPGELLVTVPEPSTVLFPIVGCGLFILVRKRFGNGIRQKL